MPESNTLNAPHTRVHAPCMHSGCMCVILVGLPRPPPMETTIQLLPQHAKLWLKKRYQNIIYCFFKDLRKALESIGYYYAWWFFMLYVRWTQVYISPCPSFYHPWLLKTFSFSLIYGYLEVSTVVCTIVHTKMDSLYQIGSKMLHGMKVIIFILWHLKKYWFIMKDPCCNS